MKILLLGVGEVGFNLAKYLSNEDYDITVIDIDPHKCNRIKNTVDAHVIEGDGSSHRIYESIDMETIDYFLPLTKHDEVNLVASSIASATSPLVTVPKSPPSSPTCFLIVNLPIVDNAVWKSKASCFNLSAAIFSFSFFLSICLRTAGVTFIALP